MTRKKEEDIRLDIEQQLNQGINLIDYFLVIGANIEIFKCNWLYNSSIDDINNNHSDEISPIILSKFPPFNKTIIGIDETIISHCFPHGYQAQKFDIPPEPELFSIILDNNNYSSKFNLKYVTCLIIYESIYKYKILYDKYYNKIAKSDDSLSVISNTLITLNTSVCSYKSSSGSNKVQYKKYYLPKCLCIISLHPFLKEFSKIVHSIYSYSTIIKSSIPIEKIIENLTIEVPVPPRGIYNIEYYLINEKRIIQHSQMNKLPMMNYEFDKLFSLFSVDKVVEIFYHLMLNSRIIFFSKNIELLTPLILSSLSLIYPFHFPFNIVSILPNEAYNLIDNISPIVVGVNEEYYPEFFTKNDIEISDVALIVNVDKSILQIKKGAMSGKIPLMPKKQKEKLIKEITQYLEIVQKKAKDKFKESAYDFEKNIRNFFLNFLVKTFENYSKYLDSGIYSHQKSKNPLENAFKIKEFLDSVDEDDREFYKRITDTQMFCDFIYKRMTPREKIEKIEILYFEEKIYERVNKNRISKSQMNTVFLNSIDYEVKKIYSVKPRKLTKSEISHFHDNEFRNAMLLNGAYITSNPTFPDNSTFTYYIFPKLESNYFYLSNLRNYFTLPNLSTEISNINSDLIAKSHLSSVEIKSCEMEDYIYLSWIKLWAFSFWYHDKEEKLYRFNQMLKVLDMVIHHEIEVFNSLFRVLSSTEENDEMIFLLYERIIYFRLNPSVYIFDIMKHLIEKKNKKQIKINTYSKKQSLTFISQEKQKIFKRRTFKNEYDSFILNEDIKFYMSENCLDCNAQIVLIDLLNNINEANKEICWATCKKCGNLFVPKLTIRFGKEVNKNGNLNNSTSIQDNIVLYSPYTLYYTMINTIVKNDKIEIDSLKKNFNPLFWNFIWYFKAKKIPYDFLLPYECNISAKLDNINIKNENSNLNVFYAEKLGPLDKNLPYYETNSLIITSMREIFI